MSGTAIFKERSVEKIEGGDGVVSEGARRGFKEDIGNDVTVAAVLCVPHVRPTR
jgi:hypothetical protein